MLFDYINFKLFLLSLTIGLFFVYIIDVPKRVIYIKPNVDNVDKVMYKDSSDSCFRYVGHQVTCPVDKSKIENVKLQK